LCEGCSLSGEPLAVLGECLSLPYKNSAGFGIGHSDKRRTIRHMQGGASAHQVHIVVNESLGIGPLQSNHHLIDGYALHRIAARYRKKCVAPFYPNGRAALFGA